MNQPVEIASLDHPALAPYARLTEAQLLNRLHPDQSLFICESLKVIQVALTHGLEPISFLCEAKFLPQVPDCGVPVYHGSRELLSQLTGYTLSRGILCAMRRPTLPPVERVLCDARRVAVLDGVVNSENTGAIFRAAAALGVDAVLLTRTCCDPLNRRACRVSMGTVFQMPWTYMDHYGQLRTCGFTTVALALTDRSVPIDHPSLQQIDRAAIILGTEGDGLDEALLRQCDHVARIPMQHGVDSLNVAAAAAVAFWQLRTS
ncbi:MAG: rRNA methylase [bacterium P3]|nr:MAG: rRNA methylase [bacterium P3]KWW42642.1 MAG: rRNA methylase [bacterium F083]